MQALITAAADHAWRLDISSLAAILAAAGTGLLAFYTWRLARETRNLARETEEDVRAEWRPVLVAGYPGLSVDLLGGEAFGRLSARITNVGRGPALNIQMTVAAQSSVEEKQSEFEDVGSLAPGDAASPEVKDVLVRDSSGGQQSSLRYVVKAAYEDLSGRIHQTTLTFEDPKRGSRAVPPMKGQLISFNIDIPHTHVS